MNKYSHLGSSSFLTCYHLQKVFSKYLNFWQLGISMINEDLLLQMKNLLRMESTTMLSLTKWEQFFQIMSLSKVEHQMVFMRMLHECKYTKFWEINFKILARILLTPKILSHMKQDMLKYLWCRQEGTLEHMLFQCTYVTKVWKIFVEDNTALLGAWSPCVWCFGSIKWHNNPIIWIVNFAIYKSFLRAMDGYKDCLYTVVQSESMKYECVFPILSKLQWTEL